MRAEDIKEFLGDVYDWRPDAGVVSVYVGIDRGDRGDGWRLALREQLRDQAIEPSIAERVLRRFPENGEPPAGRSHIGFFAVGEDREVWHSLQSNGISTAVHHEPAAHLTPLVRLLAEQHLHPRRPGDNWNARGRSDGALPRLGHQRGA